MTSYITQLRQEVGWTNLLTLWMSQMNSQDKAELIQYLFTALYEEEPFLADKLLKLIGETHCPEEGEVFLN